MAGLADYLGLSQNNYSSFQQNAFQQATTPVYQYSTITTDSTTPYYEYSNIGGLQLGTPGASHLGQVRDFRRKFKEYSKETFREMGSNPLVKDIMKGLTKLNSQEIAERIKEHMKD